MTGRLRAALGRSAEEAGQLSVLVIGLAAVLVLLVTVVVNASKAFLVQRSLAAAADGAAVAAAGAVDESVVYGPGVGDVLPLSGPEVRSAVAGYAADARLEEQFVGFAVEDVATDGVTATVTFSAAVSMPLVNLLSADLDGYRVQVRASARSPLR